MRNRIARMFKKKEKAQPFLPFAITVMADPMNKKVGWRMVNFGPVPYPLIYQALDKCRNDFVLQEAANQNQRNLEEQRKNAQPNTKPNEKR